MSDVLFVHDNFPAKFDVIAEKLHSDVRKAARETILRCYDRVTICQPAWTALVEPMPEAR